MRVVSWFSCGAASAVATVLAAIHKENVEAVYCRVREEHEDNLRFLRDFTEAFHIPVKVIENESFAGSIYNVFLRRQYIKNQYGAPCTNLLKKDMRKAYQKPGDIQVFGYTSEEQDRADRFLDANNDVTEWFPLIENNLSKRDCLDLITNSGLGYDNNNCIGCVKGGMGYWNKIRKDFPMEFEKMAKLERTLNFAVNKDKNGMIFLDELDPKRGRFKKDQPGDCGFTCEVSK